MERKAWEEQKKLGDLSSASTIMRVVATISNIVFLGFPCWVMVNEHPHPEEDGLIAFTVLMVLTPILTLVALFGSGKRKMQEQQRTIAGEQWARDA